MQQFLSAPSLLGLAFAGLGLLAGLSTAQANERDVAKIFLKANGAEQRIDVDMLALQPGQSRQLFTESGLPAIVSRDEQGLSIELAGETHQVRMPKVMNFTAGAAVGDGDVRTVVIKRDAADGAPIEIGSQVRVIRVAGNEGLDTEDVDALLARALAEAGANGVDLSEFEADGRKIRVVRRIETQPAQ